MKKKSLVERVLAILKGGDEAKLARFESKLAKYFDKQVAIRKEAIETLKDKVADATELLNDAITSVDPGYITTTDNTESYCKTYVTGLDSKLRVIEALEDDIKTREEEITRLEKLRERIYPADQA